MAVLVIQVENLEPFDKVTDDWVSYTKSFELFAKCNIIKYHMFATFSSLVGKDI